MTSLLANDGVDQYLTKLKNGICLSNINLNFEIDSEQSIKNLNNIINLIPLNLNGFDLTIILTLNSTLRFNNAIILEQFYGGKIFLLVISSNNNKSYLSIKIKNC
jgi:hypothetical protein